MTWYPEAPGDDACWALFDSQTLVCVFTWEFNANPEMQEQQAFLTLNANRDEPLHPYLVKCLWQDRNDWHTFYEVGDRYYAPQGDDPDVQPPES